MVGNQIPGWDSLLAYSASAPIHKVGSLRPPSQGGGQKMVVEAGQAGLPRLSTMKFNRVSLPTVVISVI